MSGALTDNFMQVAAAGAETYMTGTGKAIGATSFTINNATGWPTTTGFIVAIRQVNAQGVEISGTYTEWVATLSGTTISLGSSPTPVVGTDQVYSAGNTTQVYIPLSATRDNRLIAAILNQHNQDGTHNFANLAAGSILPASLATHIAIGTMPVPSSTGNQSVTGLGFKPKLVKFTWLSPTNANASGAMAVGAMTSSAQYSAEMYCEDSFNGRQSDTAHCIAVLVFGTGADYLFSASYVSMDANGFTINFDYATSGQNLIAWEAWG